MNAEMVGTVTAVEAPRPRRIRPARMLAHLGLTTAVISAVAGVVLGVVDRDICEGRLSAAAQEACAVAEADGRSAVALALFVGAGLASAVVGWFVVTRRGGLIGGLLLLFGISFTVGPAAGAYRLHAIAAGDEWPAAAFAGWVELAVFNNPAVFVPFALAVLLFPTGKPLGRRWAIIARLLVVGGLLAVVGVMAEPIRHSRWRGGVGGVVLTLSDIIEIPSLPLIALGTIAAAASLVVRLRRSQGNERRQVGAFLRGTAALVPLIALAPIVFAIDWLWPVWALLVALAAGFIPVMLGIAIVGHGLYGLERLVNRAVVYGLLTVVIVAAYVAVVTVVAEAASRDAERIAALATTAAVAVMFHPLRQRVQRTVDRLLFGFRSEPALAASELARGLAVAGDDHSPLVALAEATASSLRLPYVEIAAQDDEVQAGAAGRLGPAQSSELVRYELVYRCERVGALSCLAREENGRLTAQDEEVLGILLPSIGVAVHAASLAAALERSRDRLVDAQEAEQARIRRDLHDTLGPALTGIGLGLGELEERAEEDRVHLERLRAEVSTCIQEIRRIAHDLQPLALTEHGLVGALRVHAERFSALGLRVDIDASGGEFIAGTAIERAVYRIAAEALANVHRHANATQCKVRLRVGSEVELEVVDDGSGIDTAVRGVGLRSIEERTRDLNGQYCVEPAPTGGTRVRVVLPVPA